MNRVEHITAFYAHLQELERRSGGKRTLADCHGRMGWPERGIYFFFESDECRSDSGAGPRVVRVGTHGLTAKSRATLWNRLRQHRGTQSPPGGNHRGSIFRLLIGEALIARGVIAGADSWGHGSNAPRAVKATERQAEKQVSRYISAMPFLFLAVPDNPGPDSQRGYIERNAIAMLSNYTTAMIDPPSPQWLGISSTRERVRRSGLWNSNHVDEDYSPAFLNVLGELIAEMG